VVTQTYVTHVDQEYVITGNAIVMTCEIPSFVADFVHVTAWQEESSLQHFHRERNIGSGIQQQSPHFGVHCTVVTSEYRTLVVDESVLRGNSAILKCLIPSFVADFVAVGSWFEEINGVTYHHGRLTVVLQQYRTAVPEAYVLESNSVVLRCTVPSFVADFVTVQSWVEETAGLSFHIDSEFVVPQPYRTHVYETSVLRGNSAIFKCEIPSFVADFVHVTAWQDEESSKHYYQTPSFVVSQSYRTNVLEASVLRGNSAIFKCEIPSFVADFVHVTAWQDDVSRDYYYPQPDIDPSSKYLVLPSGELHIANVTEEDGNKSFRCRTQHRLTGDTKLSATAGRLVISS
ncbi:Immunoglobulin-like domain, partial [Trinorchestia longiramus]